MNSKRFDNEHKFTVIRKPNHNIAVKCFYVAITDDKSYCGSHIINHEHMWLLVSVHSGKV